jgi:DNA-binding transcriptional ArsR family regulator
MEARRDVFRAIADPTRREIIHLIAQEPRHLNAIAENFDMTRQAISLHIKILEECGLIEIKQQGRERICAARLEKLQEVQDWISQYESFWKHKMQALRNFLEDNSSTRKSKKK